MARTSPSPARVVVIDLSNVTSFDHTGVEMLRKAQQLAADWDVALRIVTDGSAGVAHILDGAGLDQHMARYHSVMDALRADPHPAP